MIDRMVARRRSASNALLVLGDIACQVACQAVGWTGWLGRQESNYRISNDAERLLNSPRRPTDGPNPPFR
jgi:hypothetical protein